MERLVNDPARNPPDRFTARPASRHSPHDSPHHSRREFLLHAGLVAGAAGAASLAGCDLGGSGRGAHAPITPSTPAVPSRSPEAQLPEPAAAPSPMVQSFVPPSREPLIRVRIARTSGDTPVVLGAEGGAEGTGRQWLRIARVPERSHGGEGAAAGTPGSTKEGAILVVLAAPIRVTSLVATSGNHAGRGGWSIVDATGHRSTVDGGAPIEIAALRGQMPRIIVDGTTYPGVVRLVARTGPSDAVASSGSSGATAAGSTDAGIDVVNLCPMEQYLPGVLARELYANWNLQTYLAQAIAARSFAAVESIYWSQRRHFDVVAGQASQAYVGVTSNDNANRAVRDTNGTVLIYSGELVPGYYSSCCGGVSASAVDAISDHPVNDIPPLRARPPLACCSWAPLFTWTSDQAPRDAAKRLAAWSTERSHLRLPTLAEVASVEAIQVNEYGRPVRFRVTDARGGRVELLAEQLRAALNASAPGLAGLRRPIRSGNFAGSVQRGALVCRGNGFGHGVGLCQHGAEGMARDGTRWRTIVETYYPGATIARTWA